MPRIPFAAALVAALLLVPLLGVAPATAADVGVPAVAETPPVRSSGDAADDAAIWIHPSDPSKSVVIGTDKLPTGGLGVYDLAGNELHFYEHGSMNNVDLRYNFPLGNQSVALVGVTERNADTTGAAFYKVNPADRSLTPVGRIDTAGRPRGFGMYHSPVTGKFYAFLHDFHTNVITQYELDGSTGAVVGTPVRSFDNGNTSEGIVADDELAKLYVAEEDVALWRYGAEPGDGESRNAVVTTSSGLIQQNIKNPSIYYASNRRGYLIVSSQGGSNFVVLERESNAYVGSFNIEDGNGVDKVTGQDGAEVNNFNLGPAFPEGIFVSQDHQNNNAGNGNSGNQNYKYASWGDIARAFSPQLLIDNTYDPRTIGGAPPPPPGPDTKAPTTTITSGPSGTSGGAVEFAFSADEPASFECQLDSLPVESCSSPKSYSGLSAGSHTFKVFATDTAGNVESPVVSRSWTVDLSVPVVTPFDAVADASVLGSSPGSNVGGAVDLLADSSPVEESYLRFDVQGLGGSVQNAVLRLYATNGSSDGPAVYGAGNGWAENAITFGSGRPADTSGVVDDKAAVAKNAWVEYDVSSLVTGNGAVSFHLVPTSSDGTDFSSREAGSNRPQLVVTSAGGPPPPDTQAPQVSAVAPQDKATGVAVGSTVRVTFSEAMDAATVTTGTVRLDVTGGGQVPGTVAYDAATNRATLTPDAALALDTGYTVTVGTGAQDKAGNPLQNPFTSTFHTAAPPPPDTKAPTTAITSGPSGTSTSTTAQFAFSADEPASFECQLDSLPVESCSSPKSYSGLSAGSHTFKVFATDTAGNVESPVVSRSWTVDLSVPVVTPFDAVADASVLGSSPGSNVGGAVDLLADSSPVEESYLRFDVQGLGGSVQNAVLRLYATNGSSDGPAVYGAGNGWAENAITFGSGRPADTSGVVDDKAAVAKNAWVEYDVSSLVTGNGAVSFHLVPTSSDGTDFSSREAGSNRPQLVVTSAGGPPPPDTQAPQVSAVAPQDKATGVAVGSTVRVTFSEAMDAATVTTGTVRLDVTGGGQVPGTVAYDAATNRATLTPDAALALDTGYTVTVGTGAQDKAGNPLQNPFTSTFHTAAASPPPPPPGAGIVRESVATTVNSSSSGDVTVDRPAGTVAGDVLVACLAVNGASVATGGVPQGWATLAEATSAGNPKVFGYYRVAQAGEPAQYTWGLSGSASSSGGIARYSGVSVLDTLEGSPSVGGGGSTTSATIAGPTTTVANTRLVGCMGANSSNPNVVVTEPTGMTAGWDLEGKRQQMSDGPVASPGATGDRTWTFSSGRAWAGWLVALRPR